MWVLCVAICVWLVEEFREGKGGADEMDEIMMLLLVFEDEMECFNGVAFMAF